jgi:hypothetical protein
LAFSNDIDVAQIQATLQRTVQMITKYESGKRYLYVDKLDEYKGQVQNRLSIVWGFLVHFLIVESKNNGVEAAL